MLFTEPPVIWAVSVYLKSARAGSDPTEPTTRSRQSATDTRVFIERTSEVDIKYLLVAEAYSSALFDFWLERTQSLAKRK